MRKKQIVLFLFILVFSSSVLAFQNPIVNPGERKVAYYVMPDQLNPTPSSALLFNQGIDEKLSFEFTMVSYRSWYLVTPYTYQVGLHSNYRFFDAGGLKLTGITGLGGLYAGNVGTSLAFDFGMAVSLGWFSGVVLPSIFSDGMLLAYGVGFNIPLPILKASQVVLGGRGNLTLVKSEERMGFSNRLYGIIGIQALI